MPHYPTRQKVRPINPHKLALSKWTAVVALNKEKHFLVTRVVPPSAPICLLQRSNCKPLSLAAAWCCPGAICRMTRAGTRVGCKRAAKR